MFETSVHVTGNVDIVLRVTEGLLSRKTLILAQEIEGDLSKVTVYIDSA